MRGERDMRVVKYFLEGLAAFFFVWYLPLLLAGVLVGYY